MAWLNATPKPPDESRRARVDEPEALLSRAEQMKRDNIIPAMPPNPAPHILARLFEIGVTETAGMGVGPLSWQSIAGWQTAVGIQLPRWEARLMRHLSIEYVAESRRAESENCPPPWRSAISEREKQAEVDRLQILLG